MQFPAFPGMVKNRTLGEIALFIGTMQAAEALKVVMQIGRTLSGRLLMLDAMSMEWTRIGIKKNPACPVCGQPSHSPS